MLEIKNTVTEMKTASGGLLSRLDPAKRSLKVSQEQSPKLEKGWTNKKAHPRTVEQFQKL